MSLLKQQIKALTQQVELLTERILELETENQQLRDKIARLKIKNHRTSPGHLQYQSTLPNPHTPKSVNGYGNTANVQR